MTTNREAMCHSRGHAWLPWGLWFAVMPKINYHAAPSAPVDTSFTVPKYRTRQCERCGAEETHDAFCTLAKAALNREQVKP